MKRTIVWGIVSWFVGAAGAGAQTHTNRLPEHFGKQSGPGGTWVAPKAQESSAAPGVSGTSEGGYSPYRSSSSRRPLSRRLRRAGDTLERALQATNRGHYAEAVRLYRRALAAGGRRSRFVRGEALLEIAILQASRSAPGHDWEAFRWVQKRAREYERRCYCRGLYALAVIADNGVLDKTKNVDEAGGWYQRIEACIAQRRGALSPAALAHVRRRLASIPEELEANAPKGRARAPANKRADRWEESGRKALEAGGAALLGHAVERAKAYGPDARSWLERAAEQGEERVGAHIIDGSTRVVTSNACDIVKGALLTLYGHRHMKEAPAAILGGLRRAAEDEVAAKNAACDAAYGDVMLGVRPAEAFPFLCRAAARGHASAKVAITDAEARGRVKCAELLKTPVTEPRSSRSEDSSPPAVSGEAAEP